MSCQKSLSSDLSKIKSSFKSNIKSNMFEKKSELDEITIYKNLQKIDKNETKPQNIPKWYIKNRLNVLELIEKFGKLYEFTNHTLYAAINFTDKILINEEELNQKNLTLIVIACCLMASKFVENDAFDIDLNEVISITKSMNYTIDDLYQSEIYVVQKLNYNLLIPSVYEFIQYLNIIGVFYQGEIKNIKRVSNDIQDITRKVMFHEIALKYPNEVLAMGIIKGIRKKYDLERSNMKKIIKRYNFTYDKSLFDNCYDDIRVVALGLKPKKHHHHHHKDKNKDNESNKNKENENNNKEYNKRQKFVRKAVSSNTAKLFSSQLKTIEEYPNNKREKSSNKTNTMYEKDLIKEEEKQKYNRSNTKGKNKSPNSSLDISSEEENKNIFEVHNEEVNKRELLDRTKKKNLSVRINESINQYFEDNSPTSIKLTNQPIKKEKEKSRKIKPVNKDKINFPFSIKRAKKISFVSPNYKSNYQNIEVKEKLIKTVEMKNKKNEEEESDEDNKFHKVKSSYDLKHNNLNNKNTHNTQINNKGYKTPIYIEEK